MSVVKGSGCLYVIVDASIVVPGDEIWSRDTDLCCNHLPFLDGK